MIIYDEFDTILSPDMQTRLRQIGKNIQIARKREQKTVQQATEMMGTSVSSDRRMQTGDPSAMDSILFWVPFVLKKTPKTFGFHSISCTMPDNSKRKWPGIPGHSGQYRTILDDDLAG